MRRRTNFSAALLAAYAVAVCVFAGAALAAEPAPGYVRMDGTWESRAVKTEPAHLLGTVVSPEPEKILGEREGDAIVFTVAHDGKIVLIFHAYDRAANRTFGVLAPPGGPVVRAVTEHAADADTVTFYDAAGRALSTERHQWMSDDRFETEASITHDGAPATVWYVTRRIEGSEE